jgi:hypothetical protein
VADAQGCLGCADAKGLAFKVRRFRKEKEHQQRAFFIFCFHLHHIFAQISAIFASCSMPLGETVTSLKTQSSDWDSLQDATQSGTNLSDRSKETMGPNLELEAKRYSYANV